MRLLRESAVSIKTGFSKATIWRKVKNDPDFPKPIKVGEKISAWVESELDDYLEQIVRAHRSRKAA